MLPNTKKRRPGRRHKPNATTWQDYERIPFVRPKDDREAEALEWFKNLEPFERLQLIVKFYYAL